MKECVTIKDLYKLIFYYGTLCNSESALPKYIFCFENGVVVISYNVVNVDHIYFDTFWDN